MLRYRNNRIGGFTLIELAIVLGVAGVLFGGLWRLFSTGNSQMRDQATANQQAQLIAAINTYLQTGPGLGTGQDFLATINASSSKQLPLPLPAGPAGSAGCAALIPTDPGLCTVLPAGFSTATKNPYGQSFAVRILKDNTPVTVAPKSYSFMILTNGGDTIEDTSGGRISAMIGGDGGFVYTTSPCGAPDFACGAYGAWSVTTISFGYTAGFTAPGHVASRTYYAPTQDVSSYWLARVPYPGDTATYSYNTMSTTFYLGNQNFDFASFPIVLPSTGVMNVEGGTINIQGGTLYASDAGGITTGGTIDLGGSGELKGSFATATTNSLINLQNTTCTQNTPGFDVNLKRCNFTATVQDLSVLNLLSANAIWALEHLYNPSDIRLKKDIKPISNALTDVMKLKPVSYELKSDGKANMGVIAQDLEKVYPQLVTSGAGNIKAVEYNGLIAPLIGAVQELKKENDDLRNRLNAQAESQEKMEQEISGLNHSTK